MNIHKVHCIYTYAGPEVSLGGLPITVVRMTVDSLETRDGQASAEGGIVIMDHAEGCSGDAPWVASGVYDGQKFCWTVMRKTPKADDFCFHGSDGEPLFTLLQVVNDAIKTFVATKLDYVIDELKKNPLTRNIVDEVRTYSGPMYKYTGPCVCNKLSTSNRRHPFNWLGHTNNGQFPKLCFECSCGCRWYHLDEEMWLRVGGEETWKMLTQHDGVIVEPLNFDPEIEEATLTLLKSIRQRGFIPIG